METGGTVVKTRGVTKRYVRLVALHGLTLSVDRGQILGFIGPNSAVAGEEAQ